MRRFIFLTILAVGLANSSLPADPIDLSRLQGLGEIHYRQLESSVVERSFHLFIRLPESYDEETARSYPTVYLLDGGVTFPLLASYYRYLSLGEEVFDSILVGIAYGTDHWQAGNHRSTDYTAPSKEREFWGGAARFQTVLEQEVFPLVEESYRSIADRRVIFGQSLGGQFVLYTALTRPGLFWGHIASNPALHRNLDFFMVPQWNRDSPAVDSALFVSSGSDDEAQFREPALGWIAHWSGQESLPWRLKTTTLEGQNHFSAAPEAFRQGMVWMKEIGGLPPK